MGTHATGGWPGASLVLEPGLYPADVAAVEKPGPGRSGNLVRPLATLVFSLAPSSIFSSLAGGAIGQSADHSEVKRQTGA
jgi:hypothetical protein